MHTQAIFEPNYLEGPRLKMRLIVPEDSAYVYALRTDPAYNSHLSKVSGTVEDQATWIRAYKSREALGEEYYFVIERRSNGPCGLVRLYGFSGDSFTWGSWILDQNKPPKAALESAVLIYQAAFEALGYARAVFEVRRENTRTLAFHGRFGAQQTSKDEKNRYFVYTKKQFLRDKTRFLEILRAD